MKIAYRRVYLMTDFDALSSTPRAAGTGGDIRYSRFLIIIYIQLQGVHRQKKKKSLSKFPAVRNVLFIYSFIHTFLDTSTCRTCLCHWKEVRLICLEGLAVFRGLCLTPKWPHNQFFTGESHFCTFGAILRQFAK